MQDFDRESFEEELKEARIEYKPGEFKPDFLTRILLKFRPQAGFKRLNRKLEIENDIFDKADAVFQKAERIELYPISGSHRGFVLVIDLKTALYFYQDGDHFKYDGFEIGEYEKGNITVFDNINDVER